MDSSRLLLRHQVLGGKIDALEELHSLTAVQIRRLSTGLESEEQAGALRGAVSQAMDLLRETLVSTIKLEMDLGLRRRATPEGEAISDDDFRNLLAKLAKEK